MLAMSSNSSTTTPDAVPVEHSPESAVARLCRVLGPSLPGIVLDIVDALSLTRLASPLISFPAGFVIGSWLSMYYPFRWRWRVLVAVGSGLYTLTPGTEAIPLATILTCLGRFIEIPMVKPPHSVNLEVAQSTDEATSAMAANAGATTPAESIAALAPSSTTLRSSKTRAACPECGCTSLRYGQVAQRFWPAGAGTWSRGHEVNAFVCMDCGFVGHYVTSSALDELAQS